MEYSSESGMVQGADYIESPNCDERPEGAEISVLVIHAISLPPSRFGGDYVEALFTNRLNPDDHPSFGELAGVRVSAHFYIRRDGALVQFVPTRLRAWHAGESEFRGQGRVNDFSIGIELEGCDDREFEAGQYRMLGELTRLLTAAHPAIDADAIVGHCDIAPGRKTDPGPCFDWQRYRDLL